MIFYKFHTTIICFWLSLQIILGSVGLPIIEHYCQMSGMTNTSILVKTKKCCCKISEQKLAKLIAEVEQEKNHSFSENSKDDCCDTETIYEKIDFEAIALEKTHFDFDHFVALLPSQNYFKNLTEKPIFTAFQILHFTDLPPPNWKLGKLYIVFIQVFRW
ncbi:HYC_CC_PP family protein [Bernardetia sp.]|uniref:HYC_CC_PP family protein n=1 Tax=Bernardetia sp. TaxID=1937974 RepID=UPI0025BF12C2|nr:hypothetical protein [Bernardetia sp.]